MLCGIEFRNMLQAPAECGTVDAFPVNIQGRTSTDRSSSETVISTASGWSSELEIGVQKCTSSPISQLERVASAPPFTQTLDECNLNSLINRLSLDRECDYNGIYSQQVGNAPSNPFLMVPFCLFI